LYLRTCAIQNTGPIDSVNFELEFNGDGTPKPLVLVGRNGTGKSVLLSSIIDALVEFAKRAFQNIVKGQTIGNSPYFKVVGGRTIRSGASFGIALLKFSAEDRNMLYVEKSGSLDSSEFRLEAPEEFAQLCDWEIEDNVKKVDADKDVARREFLKSAICYFPTGRHERPHWLNTESLDAIRYFEFRPRYEGRLGKPLVVQSATTEIKEWALNVVVDSLLDVDFVLDPDSNRLTPTVRGNTQQSFTHWQARRNIDAILREVVQDDGAELQLVPRIASDSRLQIRMSNGTAIPSLDHLSSGQANLFNMFCTILRYAEHEDLSKSIALAQIEGLVVIDEIEAQAHTDLQYQVIPRLMRLFPKVQFIVTSHSPLLLLGLEKAYGSDGVQIIEMPDGNSITTDRFSEFERSWEVYRETTAYETAIGEEVAKNAKPMVFVEGPTDVDYITTAFDLLNRQDLAEKLEVKEVGQQTKTGREGGGKDGLNNARRFLDCNPDLISRRVLLLYDRDANKENHDSEQLWIRTIPHNLENQRITAGIENLLPLPLVKDEVYETRSETTRLGEKKTYQTLKKRELCDLVCLERKEPSDFIHFEPLFAVLEEFLEIDPQ
jgi:hypothetical protein